MIRLVGPLVAQIELTQACNQRCVHCYNFWRYTPRPPKGELRQKDFLSILKIMDKIGVGKITLTGGEPLLKTETAIKMVKLGTELNIKMTLNTNACQMTPEIARRLKEAGLRGALVSVIGAEATHNRLSNGKHYIKAIDGIRMLIEAGIRVSINMVVMRDTVSDIQAVADNTVPLGIATFNATPLRICHESHIERSLTSDQVKEVLRNLIQIREKYDIPVDTLEPITRCIFTEEEEDEFISFFGRRRCSAAITSCTVSAHGDIRPCATADKSYGNILQEPFAAIWGRLAGWSCSSILPSACANCNANVVCEGGCRMAAKIINGSYDAPDPYMIGPIMDPKRVSKVAYGNVPNISGDELLRINPECRFRKEDFGWSVLSSGVEFITDKAYQLITGNKGQSFTANSLSASNLKENPALSELLGRLVQAGALITIKSERRHAS